MRFSIAQKSTPNRKNLQSWRPMANRTGFLERPGGMSGGTGEGTMGRGQRSLHEFCMQCEAEFCRMLTCVWHALPQLEARGGGIAYAHSAGPRLWFAVVLRGRAVRCQTKLHVVLWGCGVVVCVCVCVLLAAWVPKSSKNLLRSPTSTKTEQKWSRNRPQMGSIWARGGEGATENQQQKKNIYKKRKRKEPK